ncbi:j domain-containing [Trichoderma arundinaceum]|uniref:J domain-containing n=1 Tax=Trichoderma arundinaceum TaxID=490622 RepID=A0A395NSR0_TRIAR|nr:j domain-containing [Trichoderma arundinaceum]
MKIEYLVVGVLSLLTPLAAAWSKDDREIFRIRDEIAAHESDPAATFYDILGVSASASQDDINKAYRKKSRLLHPDKVKQQLRADKAQTGKKNKGSGSAATKGPTQAEIRKAVKEASERQARISLIANILRGPGRDRYDHFLANGFPLWKGTDYYYNRYRPGLGTVLVGVFVMGGGAIHYLALYMSWKRQKEFVERYVTFARNTAWGGGTGIPGIDATPAPPPAPAPAAEEDEAAAPPQPRNRRERRMQEKESRKDDGKPSSKKSRKAVSSKSSSRDASAAPTPTGARKRVVAENGKILVVDSQGDVFLEEEDEEGNVNEYLLDPNELLQPTFKDTAVVRVPVWIFRSTVGRVLFKDAAQAETEEAAAEEDSDVPQHTPPSSESAGEDFEILDKSTDSLSKVKTTGAQQGGKPTKRKTTKKR